jgi:hypothetical protein
MLHYLKDNFTLVGKTNSDQNKCLLIWWPVPRLLDSNNPRGADTISYKK